MVQVRCGLGARRLVRSRQHDATTDCVRADGMRGPAPQPTSRRARPHRCGRTMDTHMPLPGVAVGDIGPKVAVQPHLCRLLAPRPAADMARAPAAARVHARARSSRSTPWTTASCASPTFASHGSVRDDDGEVSHAPHTLPLIHDPARLWTQTARAAPPMSQHRHAQPQRAGSQGRHLRKGRKRQARLRRHAHRARGHGHGRRQVPGPVRHYRGAVLGGAASGRTPRSRNGGPFRASAHLPTAVASVAGRLTADNGPRPQQPNGGTAWGGGFVRTRSWTTLFSSTACCRCWPPRMASTSPECTCRICSQSSRSGWRPWAQGASGR